MDESVRVLHVDDNPEFADLTATFLEREADNLSVLTATDAEEGLDRLRTHDIDCVVSDYEMPGTNGLEFLSAVREEYPDLPFVLFTGKGSEEVASDAISAGVTDYLQKETGSDQYTVLLNRIRNAVDQYRAERELEHQNNRLSALFENFPEPTLGYTYEDDEPHVASVNEAFTEVFGYEREAAIGEPVDDLIVPPDRREEARQIDEQVREGAKLDKLLRRRAKDGLRDFRFRNIRLPEDDDIDGYAIYADVTERLDRERELERQNERLEQFTSVVSHDLQNPIQVLDSSLDLAEETGDAEHFERSRRAVDRMKELVSNLLALARQGERIDERERVALAEVADTAWKTVETGDASLAVETDLTVEADENRLRQLFENLFRNAIDHGGESVTVTVGGLPEDGFYVEDDGPGIPEDRRDEVFDVGFSTARDGTGFGLAIVSQIVDAHGWEIRVTESDGGGARFEIAGDDTWG